MSRSTSLRKLSPLFRFLEEKAIGKKRIIKNYISGIPLDTSKGIHHHYLFQSIPSEEIGHLSNEAFRNDQEKAHVNKHQWIRSEGGKKTTCKLLQA